MRFSEADYRLAERLIEAAERYKLTAPEKRACHAVIARFRFGADIGLDDADIARCLLHKMAKKAGGRVA